MARKGGADPGDTHYPVIRLNIWFAISSILLVLSVVWIVIDDYNRDWKNYQREFQAKQVQRAEEAIAKLESPEFIAEMEALNQAIREGEKSLESNASAIAKAEEELDRLSAERYNTDQLLRALKADYDWIKYQVEEHRHHVGDPDADQDKVLAQQKKIEETQGKLEAKDEEILGAKEKIKNLESAKLEAIETRNRFLEERNAHTRLLESLKPSTVGGKVAEAIRDAPMLDFMAPSIVVKKVVTDHLFFDLRFPGAQKKRVDMCMSCHVPIDKAGWEEGEQPLRSHPRLDLYLSDSSPHLMSKMGCTVCHRGTGDALNFVNVDHSPSDPEERKEWEKKYHWHKMHHWDHPMLPTQFSESSCYQCHKGHTDLIAEDAPKLFEGIKIVERAGCYGCHKIKGEWEEMKKVGPSLKHIASKMDQDFAFAWIRKPTEFRPSTWMPQIFHLSNSTDPARAHLRMPERDDVAIQSIVHYLWNQSEPFELPPVPVKGDVERGKEQIQLVGCLACHRVEGLNEGNEFNDFGPDLTGIGSKFPDDKRQAWIFSWIKNPKEYNPDTRMPELRLTDQQAADIAAYLSSLRKEGWNPQKPELDRDLLNEMAAQLLDDQLTTTKEDKALRAAIDDRTADAGELMNYVGKKFISRQGCFGCHLIGGFEEATPIGTELTEWGSKDLDQLDFGNFLAWGEMEKKRWDWAMKKLDTPRIFDKGKIKKPSELLIMPKFNFSKEQIEAVTTLLLGFEKNQVGKEAMPDLSPEKDTFAHGLALTRRNNCMACHVFEFEKLTFDAMKNEDNVAHPGDGTVTITGQVTPPDLEEDEEEYFVNLWEPSATFAEPEDEGVASGGRVSDPVAVHMDSVISQTPRKGGGLFASLENQASSGGLILLDGEGKEFRLKAEGSQLDPHGPPPLAGEGRRVQTSWLYEFLKSPRTIRPAVGVKMPTFGFTDEEASTIASYFAIREQLEYPSLFTRHFRRHLGMSRLTFAQKAGLAGDEISKTRTVADLESGKRVSGDVFSLVKAFAERSGYDFAPPPKLPFEEVRERSDEYLAALDMKMEGWLPKGRDLTHFPETVGGGGCLKCHWSGGEAPPGDPFQWAPDLAEVPRRMRGTWTYRWLVNPFELVPGTKMPKPAVGGEASAKILPGTFEERIKAIKDYLMNYDRVPQEAETP